MNASNCRILFTLLVMINLTAFSQRTYHSSSVLSNGTWFKISVTRAGIYKIDLPFLKSLGINTTNIAGSSIRIFGNGGAMLPESCGAQVTDDLRENAILVNDGGDGKFNNSDYILFYASGPDSWTADTSRNTFAHQQNLYSSRSYYYLSLGGTGKPVSIEQAFTPSPAIVSSFSDRYFYESDTINFLSSGKNWYGTEFSAQSKGGLSQDFPVPFLNAIAGAPASINSSVIARSFGGNGSFQLNCNGLAVLQHNIPGVSNGQYDVYARTGTESANFTLPAGSLELNYRFQPGGTGGQAWLDWFEVFCRSQLTLNGRDQLLFRDLNSVKTAAILNFRVEGADAATQVWDVTDPLLPVQKKTTLTGSVLMVSGEGTTLHEYVAFGNKLLSPVAEGPVPNQDLHAAPPADLLIVTWPGFVSQANRIAAFHQSHDQLTTFIATTDQVFNEFSSGIPDPTAIRDFAKMFYDRAAGGSRPRYLLLLGDASYIYKNNKVGGTNLVPCYESRESLDPLATYVTDDYFALLDDSDNINSISAPNLLDIGVGRIPAGTLKAATDFTDKLIHYYDSTSQGKWRNEMTFVADDEDFNLHFGDAEITTAAAAGVNERLHINKIYLDAFQQQSTAAGSRYPGVNQAISDNMQQGTLIWNYNGHGGFRRLAEEVVLDDNIAATFTNKDHLPLFVTATCDFAPYDNPANYSLGENILMRPNTGAIALMTTTRLVFAFSNRIINKNYLETALRRQSDGSYLSLGESIRQAKNLTYQTSGDVINNRKFTLLGDPAMTLAYPRHTVQTETINGHDVKVQVDTLQALKTYTVGGSVQNASGTVLTDFNGTVYIEVYDKPVEKLTLANDPESIRAPFTVQENKLFSGQASVANGRFTFSFLVPRDINYTIGNGRISYYAKSSESDANGIFSNLLIGGTAALSTDIEPPIIKGFLNDEQFKDGATVGASPLLILNLADSSGLNISGEAIGHDMTAILDGDTRNPFLLNNFFIADNGSYRRGSVRYQFSDLADGAHELKIKCWDAANNAAEIVLHFVVSRKESFILQRVQNNPNPFPGTTTFCLDFENAEVGKNVDVLIRIFNLQGQLMKTLKSTINLTGNRSCDIAWDGRSEGGVRLSRGIYVYAISVTTPSGNKLTQAQQLFVH